MTRKHAMVLALAFLFLGMILTPVETPFVQQENDGWELRESPEVYEKVAEEPVSQGPLIMNVVSNPGFEDWNTGTHGPEDWDTRGDGHAYGDPAYTGSIKHGNYAGYVESHAGTNMPGSCPLFTNPDTTETPYLKYGISLSLDWYLIANPDLLDGSRLFLMLWIRNVTGNYRTMYYYLSYRSSSFVNASYECYYMLNDTIGSWHTFDRNITADYIAAFGISDLSSTTLITDFYYYASSPTGCPNLMQAVIDDVSMYNSSYSDWIVNGDFELGTGYDWHTYYHTFTTIAQSTDCIDGSYSLNISKPAYAGSGYGRITRSYGVNNRFGVYEPGTNILSWDWNYNDTEGVGTNQWAFLRVSFANSSTYRLYIYMGRGNDWIPNNTTTTFYIRAPGFGLRDTWVHSEIDLYEIANEIGTYNLAISELQIEASQGVSYASLELLVDNLQMKTYPMGNPTFEATDQSGTYDPFPAWVRPSHEGEVTQSSVAHSGLYSANITVEDAYDGIYRFDLDFEFDTDLFLDFWWRLEDIQDAGESYALVYFEFQTSLGLRFIRYLLGSSSIFSPTNDTSTKYIEVDGFNQTGTWNLLSRNVTADIEAAFSESPVGWKVYQISFLAEAGGGMRTSLLLDDLHFKDMKPPSVDSVSFDAIPMYYEDVPVQIFASDTRPGVSSVAVVYTTDNWDTFDTIYCDYDADDWFNATIPAQAYDTEVKFYVHAVDGCGIPVIDANSGLYYSYTVGDDVAPALTITNPGNNTELEGLLQITANAEDLASGIEYVTFNPDGMGPINDYTAPYSQNWNLDDASLGAHFIIVTAHDNAGNSVTKTHYITVVDNTDPDVNSPADVVMTEGETGLAVNWSISDVRPHNFTVFRNGSEYVSGGWSAESYFVAVSLDGYLAGGYNLTLLVYDDAGNSASDTVFVTVNEGVTTTTTTTETTTSTTSETTTAPPTEPLPLEMMLLVGSGIAAVVLIVVFVARSRKPTQ